MRARLTPLLAEARQSQRAVAACNVYTLDQAAGVLDAAEAAGRSIILQVHPSGLGAAMWPLIGGLSVLAERAAVPVVVHLDHCSDSETMRAGAAAGVDSIMVDGSALPFAANVALVRSAVDELGVGGIEIEAELGRLSGAEDGLSVDARAARLTDPDQVAAFVSSSGAAALAVCIGNVHGQTSVEPVLDLERLEAIAADCTIPLVLHGASGLSTAAIFATIERGVAKVNVNTELRTAYARALTATPATELVDVLASARAAVGATTAEVIGGLEASGPGTLETGA